MKATEGSRVRTLVDVQADFSDHVIPTGTDGMIVEAYSQPEEGYAVDLRIPDGTLVGGFRWENVILGPHQFEVIPYPFTLYVDAELDMERFTKNLAAVVGGAVDETTIKADSTIFFVRANESADEVKRTLFPGGALYFHYEVEGEAVPDASLKNHVETLASLLSYWWSQGIAAYAVSAFRSLLPHQGGESPDVPWPGRM